MLGTSVDAAKRPEAFRVWGATAFDEQGGDRRIRTLVNADACRTFENVQEGSRVAFLFTDITTFQSAQVKGSATGPAQAPGPADMACFRRYDARFMEALLAIGHTSALRDGIRPMTVFVLEAIVDAMFDQTPGPGAGRSIEV
jgi:hypothetical protein